MASLRTELDRRLQAMNPRSGGTAHATPVRPSEQSPASNLGPSGAVPQAPMSCITEASCEPGDHTYSWPCDYAPGTGRLWEPPRRGIVVTVALSEPANLPELNWAATLASIIRLATQDTSVIVIDTWEVTK